MSIKRRASRSGFYHVIVRGVNKEPVFEESYMKKIARALIRKYLKKCSVIIYCYCIMKNHLHLLLRCEDLAELSEFMAGWEADYAKYYNGELERSGYVFQGRYKSEMIDDEEYFWTCFRYIHLNPVKAGCCEDIGKYEFTSVWEYLNGQKILLEEKIVEFYDRRFPEPGQFKRFHFAAFRKTRIMDTDEDTAVYEREMADEIYGEILAELSEQERALKDSKTLLRKRFLKEMQVKGNLSRYHAEKICEKYPGLF